MRKVFFCCLLLAVPASAKMSPQERAVSSHSDIIQQFGLPQQTRFIRFTGEILGQRYVVLEGLGRDGVTFRYLAYDLETLQRTRLRVFPDAAGQPSREWFMVLGDGKDTPTAAAKPASAGPPPVPADPPAVPADPAPNTQPPPVPTEPPQTIMWMSVHTAV